MAELEATEAGRYCAGSREGLGNAARAIFRQDMMAAKQMSWDVFAAKFPREARSPPDLPNGWVPEPVGARTHVISQIVKVVPSAIFEDELDRGLIQFDNFSITMDLGKDELVDYIMFSVHGSGQKAVDCVAQLVEALGLRAFDCQTGEFFSEVASKTSFQKWQAYRDRFTRKVPQE